MTDTDRFPFGVPINRPAPKGATPVPGRPGWWLDPKTGAEFYRKPPRPPQPMPPI